MPRKPLELQSLKWPFVLLAALLSLSTAWAVYDELFTRRPWQDYQREYYKLDVERIHQQIEVVNARLALPENKAKVDKLKAELQAAQDAVGGNAQQRADYDKALAAVETAKIRTFDAKQDLAFSKSLSDAEYYNFREARHEKESKEYEAAKAKLDALDRQIAERNVGFDKATADQKALQDRVQGFLARRDGFQKQLDAIDAELIQLQKKADKAADESPELTQYWIPDLKNPEGGPTVDRCQDCHAGVAKGGFSRPHEIILAKAEGVSDDDLSLRFDVKPEQEVKLEATAMAICQNVPAVAPPDVPGLATPEETPTPPDAAAATACVPRARLDTWKELARDYCGGADKLALKYLVKGEQVCTDQGTLDAWTKLEKDPDTYRVPLVFQTHPWRNDLLVHNHDPEKFGCAVCHGGEGMQTKGVEHHKFRHGYDDEAWLLPLLNVVKVQQARHEPQEWKGVFNQSTCNRCHAADQSLAYAPLHNQGRLLMQDVACYACHPIEGYNNLPKRGPTLMDVRSKVTTAGWLTNWIQYPKAWRPRTRMPNFWPGAVTADNLPPSTTQTPEELVAHEQTKRHDEVLAISAYLWSTSKKVLDPAPAGDAERGKDLVSKRGCMGCHVFEQGSTARPLAGTKERDYAPNLWNVGDKATRDWIYHWVLNPKAMWPETKMPNLRLTEAEAADVSTYLSGLKSGTAYAEVAELHADGSAEPKLVDAGKALIMKYGCFACHDIRGMEQMQKIGTELTEEGKKAVDLLDFGDAITDPRQQTWANWMVTKLHTPRIYGYERVETRMPQFDFSDEEAKAVLVFLRGETGEPVPPGYLAGQTQEKQAVLQGEKIVNFYGCRNCHVVNNAGGKIRDQYQDYGNAPPWLNHEGARTQPGWLFSFLKAPHVVRPWLANTIHMPTFGFTDDQATTLVQSFAADAQKPYPFQTVERPATTPEDYKKAGEFFTALQCAACHVVNGKSPAGQEKPGPELMAVKDRIRPDWLTPWLHDPAKVEPDVAMPSNWPDGNVSLPQFYNGDLETQIEEIRKYLLWLGDPAVEGAKAKKTAEAPHPAKG